MPRVFLVFLLFLSRVSYLHAEDLALTGKLLFHRYSSYDAWDGQLYLYDFSTKKLACLSKDWPIDHAMNAHFSPDGKQIVFMGVPKGKHESNSWDLFLWEPGAGEPVNLTAGNGLRDEDPQFSPDGKTLIFKQKGQVAFLTLETRKVEVLKVAALKSEWSMPAFSPDSQHVVAMAGAAEKGDLYAFNLTGEELTPLSRIPHLQEYFPVHWDKERLLFVRWVSPENHNDQIYVYEWGKNKAEPLPFCKPDANYSDPCPVDAHHVLFSSTRRGGSGGYDLYYANTQTGDVVAIKVDGINTKQEELGACYWPFAR